VLAAAGGLLRLKDTITPEDRAQAFFGPQAAALGVKERDESQTKI
jgi:hypothetical protein